MSSSVANLPPRFRVPGLPLRIAGVICFGFVIYSFIGAEISLFRFIGNIPAMYELILEMVPPDFSRMRAISVSLLETFQMAVAGTVIGVLISLPLAVLASKEHAPHPLYIEEPED